MNLSRQIADTEVLTLIREAKLLYTRLAIADDGSGHRTVRSMVIDILPQRWLENHNASENIEGPWWKPTYLFEAPGHSLFLRGFLRSEIVAAWFASPQECTLVHFDPRPGYDSRVYRFGLPDLFDQVTKQRHASFDGSGLEVIRYPHTLYTFQVQPQPVTQNNDYEAQVGWDSIDGEGAHFANFQTAQAELMFGLTDPHQIYNHAETIAVRVIHPEGWLHEIRVFQDRVEVTVGGTGFIGGFVNLDGSPAVRTRERVMSHHVTLPLPNDLPQSVQVILLNSSDKLDQAFFNSPTMYGSSHSPQVIIMREEHVAEQSTSSQDELVNIADNNQQDSAAPIALATTPPPAEDFFPFEVVAGTRGYIEKVVDQINKTFRVGSYDACAVMIRRLVETLIIEAFEANRIADRIKNAAGDFFHLRDLITKTLAEEPTTWNLSRNTKQAFRDLKDVGDISAHNRRVNAVRSDIEPLKQHVRVMVEEFLYIANLKR